MHRPKKEDESNTAAVDIKGKGKAESSKESGTKSEEDATVKESFAESPKRDDKEGPKVWTLWENKTKKIHPTPTFNRNGC